MATATLGSAIRQVHRLFDEGTVAGMTDGQLLARFVDSRDESAFEALVNRHGRMVLNTARAVLKDRHAAEDAFQAAFIALSRRAPSIRATDALGGWLHRVTYREAIRISLAAGRRRTVDEPIEVAVEPVDAELDDLRAIVHAELDRLPESFRLPVILCDLEGATKAQAAHSLGWTEATVRGRLERARVLLKSRLTRRGLGASAGLLVASIGRDSMAGVGPARVAATVTSAIKAGSTGIGWARLLAPALVGSGCLVAVLGAAFGAGRAEDPPKMAPKAAASAPAPRPVDAPAAPKPAEMVEIAGKVLDPDGKPVGGAKVTMSQGVGLQVLNATAGADGRFKLSARKSVVEASPLWKHNEILAVVPGFGPAWSQVGEPGAELTLTLARDDVPIEGRVVDLEGRAVAGVTIKTRMMAAPAVGPTLDRWIEASRKSKDRAWNELFRDHLKAIWLLPEEASPGATTDADGRFKLLGIGRERVIELAFEGPTIRATRFHAATRDMADLVLPTMSGMSQSEGDGALREVFHGRTLAVVAPPTRPVEGTVTEAATGKPLPGLDVVSYKLADYAVSNNQACRITTDAKGHFTLVGMPRGAGNQIMIKPPAGSLLMGQVRDVEDGPGLAPTSMEVALKKGVEIRGRVTDKATGKPARAWVRYHTFKDNPALKGITGLNWEFQSNMTEPDGSFRTIGIPGKGMLSANGVERDAFLPASPDSPARSMRLGMNTEPLFFLELMEGFAAVNIAEGDSTLTRDITVDSGRDFAGTVVDPDGKPATGVKFSDANLKEKNGWKTLAGSGFTVRVPSRFDEADEKAIADYLKVVPTRSLLFLDEARKLAASIVVRDKTPNPATVRLQPWGVAQGRIVDREGKPRADATVLVQVADAAMLPVKGKTDADGRFRIEGMIPGTSHDLFLEQSAEDESNELTKRVKVEPGQTRDLGDIKIRR